MKAAKKNKHYERKEIETYPHGYDLEQISGLVSTWLVRSRSEKECNKNGRKHNCPYDPTNAPQGGDTCEAPPTPAFSSDRIHLELS